MTQLSSSSSGHRRHSRNALFLVIASALIAVVLFGIKPATSAHAAPADDELVVGAAVEAEWAGTDVDLPPADELVEGYIEQQFEAALPKRATKGKQSTGTTKLTGANLRLLNILKNEVKTIADGESPNGSTIVSVSPSAFLDDFEFTFQELGITEAFEIVDGQTRMRADAQAAFEAALGYDLDTVMAALLAECPYDLYWYNKVIGVGLSYIPIQRGNALSIQGDIEFYFTVDDDYAAGEYVLDTTTGTKVNDAVVNAAAIVANHTETAVYDRLHAFKEEICNRVSYNYEAYQSSLNDPTLYGDPWQLVYVFDTDPEDATKVVCEGYSKAFQYLCDLANIKGITCRTVTGAMGGGTGAGGHMWNIVSMDDGNNYLVDVTNCDEGTIGYQDYLFVAHPALGSVSTRYTFKCDGSSIIYQYDDDTRSIFTDENLTLSSVDYVAPAPKDPVAIDTCIIGVEPSTFVYTGNEQEPTDITLYDSEADYTLVEGVDYELTMPSDMVSAGVKTIEIEGIGDYTGTTEVTYTINPRSISEVTIAAIADQEHTGEAITPVPQLSYAGVSLVENTDYTLAYDNNVNVGEATITVEGTGNFTGTTTVTFQIIEEPPVIVSISSCTVAVSPSTFTYNGSAQQPTSIVVSDPTSGATLQAGVDYSVSMPSDCTNAGEKVIVITGLGNYSGTTEASYTINKASVRAGSISTVADQTYTGSAITPVPRITVDGRTLVNGQDFTLTYANNVNVGEATITIDGIGNYSGRTKTTFNIVRRPAEWERLAGEGRYDTMAKIVQKGWPSGKGGTVVLANGYNFKDALAAAGLAGLYDAPVVLTDGGRGDKVKTLSGKARSELLRLAPKKVYIAGGPFAVPEAVEKQVKQLLPNADVFRVAGANGCSTSAELAKAGKDHWGDTAIIATDKTFKDALSAAPLSYAKHWPILLASEGKSLNNDVLKALKACDIKRAYIVGGTAAVTPAVEKTLTKNGIEFAGRLAGGTGVQTSREIADFALKNGLSVKNMAYATSQNFPDALAGAALCGKNASVLLLCDDKAQGNLSFSTQHKNDIETGYVFGGDLAFSEGLFNRLPK